MASIARVYYVLAASEESAKLLALAIHRGILPPMAKDREELVRLRLLHPVAMIGSIIPYAVFTGLEKTATSRLISGDWDKEVRIMFEQQERTYGRSTQPATLQSPRRYACGDQRP